ncbi:hypothetical protein N2152v2_009755 [Parachlorella kessleri]
MSASKEGVRDCTDEFVVEDAHPEGRGKPAGRETDPHRIAQRQKQIDLGKNTLGYQRYRQQVPRDKRRARQDPGTPDVYQIASKRSFDGQVKKWRRMLHEWDPRDEAAQENAEASAAGAPTANPPAHESSDRSYEHISHGDCQDASPASKNGACLRPANAGRPQKATLTALRKRNYSESALTCQPLSPGSAQQLPMPAKLAKVQTPQQHNQPAALALKPSMAKGAAAAVAPEVEGSPEGEDVDFGEDEDWAYIDASEAEAAADGGGATVYHNNWAALEDGDSGGLDDIVV